MAIAAKPEFEGAMDAGSEEKMPPALSLQALIAIKNIAIASSGKGWKHPGNAGASRRFLLLQCTRVFSLAALSPMRLFQR